MNPPSLSPRRTALSVNVNKVALLRNTRHLGIPSVTRAAELCLKAGAQALKSNGQPFTADSIGSALAGRMVGEHLRSMGVATYGPPPFSAADRSRFLQALDQAVVKACKAAPPNQP